MGQMQKMLVDRSLIVTDSLRNFAELWTSMNAHNLPHTHTHTLKKPIHWSRWRFCRWWRPQRPWMNCSLAGVTWSDVERRGSGALVAILKRWGLMRSTCCKLRSHIVMNYPLILRWRLSVDKLDILFCTFRFKGYRIEHIWHYLTITFCAICLCSCCIWCMSRTKENTPALRQADKNSTQHVLGVSLSQPFSDLISFSDQISLVAWVLGNCLLSCNKGVLWHPNLPLSTAFGHLQWVFIGLLLLVLLFARHFHLSQSEIISPVSHVLLFGNRRNGMGMA